MNIETLPIGTKLVWDAPEPYPGYVRNPDSKGRVIYPLTVFEHTKNAILLGTSSGYSFYLPCDSDAASNWIRKPTREEEKTMKW